MKNLVNVVSGAFNVAAIVKDVKRFNRSEGKEKWITGAAIALNVVLFAINFKAFADGNLLPEDEEDEFEEATE